MKTAAKAFIKLGLKRSHGVGILGWNAPEWHIRLEDKKKLVKNFGLKKVEIFNFN